MKVTFQISPSEEYILAHGGARGAGVFVGPSGWRHGLGSIVESKPRLGADYTTPRHRQNRTRSIGFSVEIEHPDLQTQELFGVDYPDTLPATTGDLIVETEDVNGHKKLKKYPGAAIRNVSVSNGIGVSSTITFDIVAGEVQDAGAA